MCVLLSCCEGFFLTFSLSWIINCGRCVRHGLDYLVVCSLCKSAAAIKINLCLFFHWTFSLLAQCHNSFADPLGFALHVWELFSPPGSDSVSSWSAGRLTRSVKSDCNFPHPAFHFCHDQSKPLSIPASPLDHSPVNHLCHDQSQPPLIPATPLDHHPTNRLCHDQSQPPSIPALPLDHHPMNRLCHDQSQPPLIRASPLDHPHPTNCLCYDQSQFLSIQPSQLDISLSSRLQELGIGFHLSSKCSCRGGRRKQRKISVVSGVRAASTTSNDVRRSPGTRSVDSRHLAPVTDVAADVTHRSRTSYSLRGVSFANLIPVSVQASTATSSPPTQFEIIKVLYFKSVPSTESQWHSQNDSRWQHWHSANDRDMVMCTGRRSLYCWNDASRLCAAIIPSNRFNGWRYCLHCSGHFLWQYIFQTPVLSVLRGHQASYLSQEHVHISCVPVQTPSQQEEQTLQSVVSPAVPWVSHTVCRFPQWSSTAWRF